MVDTKQPTALVICAAGLAVSTIFIALRIWARAIAWKITREYEAFIIWSDGLLMVAYVLVASETYAIIQYTLHSWQGYHKVDIPKQSVADQITAQKFNLANQLLYYPILSLVRSSVILFLLHIGEPKAIVRHILWTALSINAMLATAITFADAFQCTPARYTYDYPAMDLAAQILAGADSNGQLKGVMVKGGKCIHQIQFFLVSAAFNIVLDVVVLAIPTVTIWDLKMSRKRKFIAIGLLSSGLIVTATSVARLVIYRWRFSPLNLDRSYGVGYTISSIEANLAVATGCVPLLGPLLQKFVPRCLGNGTHTGTRTAHSNYNQQIDTRRNTAYALKSRMSGWQQTQTEAEAWSSKENIFNSAAEIRRDVKVDITFSDAVSSAGESANSKPHSPNVLLS